MVKVGDTVICKSSVGAPGRFTKGKSYEIKQIRGAERRNAIYRCIDDKGELTGQFASRWQVLENGPW